MNFSVPSGVPSETGCKGKPYFLIHKNIFSFFKDIQKQLLIKQLPALARY